jgi:hypothetical protein
MRSTQTNYEGTKKTRVTDRFVRYPYPKTLGTANQRDFKDRTKYAVVTKPNEGFNLEKETKLINPHKMTGTTTAKDAYKNFEAPIKYKKVREYINEGKPILG